MSTDKRKQHKKLHWVHLLAVLVLVAYYMVSKVNLVNALSKQSIVESFLQLFAFGGLFSVLFLYIFSHDKFLPFARDLERTQQKKEKKYLKKYLHHGKILATFIISAVGGPVFSALTARFLLNNLSGKYFIVLLANAPSTLLALTLGRGIVHFVNF